MKLAFHKFQGTGNDFILIDNRESSFKNDASRISGLCDRKFGVGADGLILLGASGQYDFSMSYFNADGIEVDMCGNGGRCIVAFARHLGLIGKHCVFQARDGLHQGEVLEENGETMQIRKTLSSRRAWFSGRNSMSTSLGQVLFPGLAASLASRL